jgi:heme/copper-type cytochrome/quinol oxidase subunit 2
MIFWFVVTFVLVVWNAIYCIVKIRADFRGPKPANGVWGLFALAGVLSTIAIAIVSLGVAASGI